MGGDLPKVTQQERQSCTVLMTGDEGEGQCWKRRKVTLGESC